MISNIKYFGIEEINVTNATFVHTEISDLFKFLWAKGFFIGNFHVNLFSTENIKSEITVSTNSASKQTHLL